MRVCFLRILEHRMRLKVLALIFIYAVCSMLAQIAFKKSARKFSASRLDSVPDAISFLILAVKMPGVWWGVFIITCGMISWLVALAHVDLSLALPIDSMQYLLILLASSVFLGERMSWARVLGTILMVAGITFVALS